MHLASCGNKIKNIIPNLKCVLGSATLAYYAKHKFCQQSFITKVPGCCVPSVNEALRPGANVMKHFFGML